MWNNAIIWLDVFWTVGQHQMRCLKIKYIETFPIDFFLILKI